MRRIGMKAGDDGAMREIGDRRSQLRAEAHTMLRRPGGDPTELLTLAKKLKNLNELGYARRLVGRAREQRTGDSQFVRKNRQLHALCTYKDPDLPEDRRRYCSSAGRLGRSARALVFVRSAVLRKGRIEQIVGQTEEGANR